MNTWLPDALFGLFAAVAVGHAAVGQGALRGAIKSRRERSAALRSFQWDFLLLAGFCGFCFLLFGGLALAWFAGWMQ